MRQLTSVDSQFLALETRRQTGHVGSVALLDPSTTASGTLTVADVEALITDRLPLLPPLRWRLREVPLGLDYPYWIDDEDFDLHFHMGNLDFGIVADREQMPDVALLVGWLRDELELLMPRPEPPAKPAKRPRAKRKSGVRA